MMKYRQKVLENREILRTYFANTGASSVMRPAYYNGGVFDCLFVIRLSCPTKDGYLGFLRGNIIKYLWRDQGKRLDDLAKAFSYWELLCAEAAPLETDYELFERICLEVLRVDSQVPLLAGRTSNI